MSTTRLGGTRTRLNRYASDASDKASDQSGSSSTLNGTSGSSGSSNMNNSSSGLYTSSYTSVGRSESFGRSGESKGLTVTDGGSYSTLASQRQYSAPGMTSGSNPNLSSSTAGRYVSLSERISPPVITDSHRVGIHVEPQMMHN